MAEIPAPTPEPAQPEERVIVVDPRRAATLTDPKSSGPRAPTQMVLPIPAPPVQLLEGQPLTSGGPVWLDPEALAQWEREEAARRRQGP